VDDGDVVRNVVNAHDRRASSVFFRVVRPAEQTPRRGAGRTWNDYWNPPRQRRSCRARKVIRAIL